MLLSTCGSEGFGTKTTRVRVRDVIIGHHTNKNSRSERACLPYLYRNYICSYEHDVISFPSRLPAVCSHRPSCPKSQRKKILTIALRFSPRAWPTRVRLGTGVEAPTNAIPAGQVENSASLLPRSLGRQISLGHHVSLGPLEIASWFANNS